MRVKLIKKNSNYIIKFFFQNSGQVSTGHTLPSAHGHDIAIVSHKIGNEQTLTLLLRIDSKNILKDLHKNCKDICTV